MTVALWIAVAALAVAVAALGVVVADRVAAPKLIRKRRARAELLMHLAATADRWSRELVDDEPSTAPFAQWAPAHPFVQLCRTHRLSPADLAQVSRSLWRRLERDALAAGYGEPWTTTREPAEWKHTGPGTSWEPGRGTGSWEPGSGASSW